MYYGDSHRYLRKRNKMKTKKPGNFRYPYVAKWLIDEHRRLNLDGKSIKEVKDEIKDLKSSIQSLRKKCVEERSVLENGGDSPSTLLIRLAALKEARAALESVGATYMLDPWEREKEELENRFDKLESATFCIKGLGRYEQRTIRFEGQRAFLEISDLEKANNSIVTKKMSISRSTVINYLRHLSLEWWPREENNPDINNGIQWSLTIHFKDIEEPDSWYATNKYPPLGFCLLERIFFIDLQKWNLQHLYPYEKLYFPQFCFF